MPQLMPLQWIISFFFIVMFLLFMMMLYGNFTQMKFGSKVDVINKNLNKKWLW